MGWVGETCKGLSEWVYEGLGYPDSIFNILSAYSPVWYMLDVLVVEEIHTFESWETGLSKEHVEIFPGNLYRFVHVISEEEHSQPPLHTHE